MDTFNSELSKLLGLEGPPHEDDRFREPIANISLTVNPLDLDLHLFSEITTSPSSQSTNTASPALTEEEAAHVDNLLFYGVDSPVLPPDLYTSSAAVAETPQDLASAPDVYNLIFIGVDRPVFPPNLFTPFVAVAETPPGLPPAPSQPSSPQTISHESPLPASSALFSPTTACAAPSVSPPAHKRQYSLLENPNPSQDPPTPTPGPSAPRPAKRRRIPFPGEPTSQLDTIVPPLEPLEPSPSTDEPNSEPPIKPIQPAGPPMGKPRATRNDYSLCQCPGGLTSKPARHWRTCPYNPAAGSTRFVCEICGKTFTRDDNKDRHVKELHT